MILTRSFELSFDEENLRSLHGNRFAGLLERPALRARFERVLEEAARLVEPAACYDAFPIEKLLHDRLQLAGGIRIGGGPVVSVVGGAEELYVALCTIGPALDERVREKRAQGRYLEMLLLDELGSWAVDQVRQQLYERIEVELAGRSWRTSSPLSPGESVWSIREQRIVFKLLDGATIGVELRASYLMSPLKSLSLVFGAGSQPMGFEGLSNCDFCSIRDRCTYAAAR